MDRFDAMTAFVAVAHHAGFSAAARELGIPLATISRRVADLEALLGIRLLHRSTRRVVLTEQGEAYFTACRRLLEDLNDVEESVSGDYRSPRGELSVTAPVGFGRLHLQPVLLEFLAAYPDISLRLMLVDRLVNLVEEHVDVALRIAELADSSLIARPLGNAQLIICASPAYLARHGTPARPDELEQHDCIGWSTLGIGTHWWLKDSDVERTLRVRARFTTTSADSAIAAAEAHFGLVQVPCYQADSALRSGRLIRVLSAFDCAPTPVNLVHASGRLVPLKLRAFIDFCTPRLARRLTLGAQTPGRSQAAEPPRGRRTRQAATNAAGPGAAR